MKPRKEMSAHMNVLESLRFTFKHAMHLFVYEVMSTVGEWLQLNLGFWGEGRLSLIKACIMSGINVRYSDLGYLSL